MDHENQDFKPMEAFEYEESATPAEPVTQKEPEMQEEPTQVVQENMTWGAYVQQQEQREQREYTLPFAENVYERVYPGVEPQPVKPRREKRGGGKTALWMILTIVLVVAACLFTATIVSRFWQAKMGNMTLAMNDKQAVLQAQIDALSSQLDSDNHGTVPVTGGGLMTPGQVYAENVQAVVAITATTQQRDNYGQYGSYGSMGSGFIISSDGYVVSNYHVVQGATKITLATEDGDLLDATLVGYDATNDVALLKADAQDLPYVTIGSSDKLMVGDQVAAIGNPLGELAATLTVGYVSAKDRIVATDGTAINMLQTDAAINSGNSGGPLFNMRGEVVGITTAKYSGTSSSGATIEGIGFAIPMDDVIGIIEDLRDYGYVTGAYLGVMVRDVTADGIRDGVPAGAFVEEVTPGFAAEAAGLQVRDIITDLGGYEITNVTDLTRMLRKFDAGQTVSVTVYRNGQLLQLSITLDERPVQMPEPVRSEESYPNDWYKEFFEDYFG